MIEIDTSGIGIVIEKGLCTEKVDKVVDKIDRVSVVAVDIVVHKVYSEHHSL